MANIKVDSLYTIDRDTIEVELDKDGDIIFDINDKYPTLLYLDDLDKLIKILQSARIKAIERKKELMKKINF